MKGIFFSRTLLRLETIDYIYAVLFLLSNKFIIILSKIIMPTFVVSFYFILSSFILQSTSILYKNLPKVITLRSVNQFKPSRRLKTVY